MIRSTLVTALAFCFFAALPAFANETTTTTPTAGGGAVEKTVDHSKNVLTGSKTTEVTEDVKDANGQTIKHTQSAVKRDKKGRVIRKKGEQKVMNSQGDVVHEEKTDEKVSH